jgi:hypothetical protein
MIESVIIDSLLVHEDGFDHSDDQMILYIVVALTVLYMLHVSI